MNLVCDICQIIFVISAIIVMVYDQKYQRIPFWCILINYISLSMLITPWTLISVIYIIFCKIKSTPIDILYLVILFYLIIMGNYIYSILSILICLIYIVTSFKKEFISFMVPLEIAIAIMLIERVSLI